MNTEEKSTAMNGGRASGAVLRAATVRKRLRRFPTAFRPFRRELIERYGEDLATRIEDRTRHEYGAVLPRTPRFAGRFNVFNWVIGALALFVSLFRAMNAEGKTAEEIASVLFAVTADSYRSLPAVIRWMGRRLFFSRLFLWHAGRSADRARVHPEGWEIEYRAGDGLTCDWFFECSKCGAVDFMRKHDAEGLMPYCNFVDYIQGRVFGLGMQNPENIGQGSKVCREFFKQRRPTPLPENLRSIARGADL
jgi:hypothetical protein